MSEIGRACLIETGCKSRWWGRCRYICTKFGLMELVNLILLRDVSVNGMVSIGMKMDRKVWKKYICEKIQEVGRQSCKKRFNDTEREKEYEEMKRCPRNESFADGRVGARVRLMVRGGCLPVRRSEMMAWKYDDIVVGAFKSIQRKDGMYEYEVI